LEREGEITFDFSLSFYELDDRFFKKLCKNDRRKMFILSLSFLGNITKLELNGQFQKKENKRKIS
jgi:hypothetical protein